MCLSFFVWLKNSSGTPTDDSAGGTHGALDGAAGGATATAETAAADGQQADGDDNAGEFVNRCVCTATLLNTEKNKYE